VVAVDLSVQLDTNIYSLQIAPHAMQTIHLHDR
jgi:hypothetical protein